MVSGLLRAFLLQPLPNPSIRFSSGPSHHLVFSRKAGKKIVGFAIYVHKGTEQQPSQTPVW